MLRKSITQKIFAQIIFAQKIFAQKIFAQKIFAQKIFAQIIFAQIIFAQIIFAQKIFAQIIFAQIIFAQIIFAQKKTFTNTGFLPAIRESFYFKYQVFLLSKKLIAKKLLTEPPRGSLRVLFRNRLRSVPGRRSFRSRHRPEETSGGSPTCSPGPGG